MEKLLSILLTAAAMVMAGTLVHREFFDDQRTAQAGIVGEPRFVKEWKAALRVGIEVGDTLAPVKIVEFADLECPFCARFEGRLQRLKERFPGKVSQVFVHFPIGTHKFARPAARAAECAAKQHRFSEFVNAVYVKQDSLGLKGWESYARDASIPDVRSFNLCNADKTTIARIDAGRALGDEIAVGGTPAIMINGWLFPHIPADSVLDRTVVAILQGKEPVRSKWSVLR